MRVRRLVLSVVAVLAIAAVGIVLRGALQGGASGKPTSGGGLAALPVQPQRGGGFDLSAAESSRLRPGTSEIATARGRSIRVSRHRAGKSRRVRERVFNGQRIPLTFLVRRDRGAWLQVDLPTRPNLSKGWVRRRDVRLTTTNLALVVKLSQHRIELLADGRRVMRAKVGVGEALSPTPTGRYYVTDVVKPKTPDGFYGPYALGLSAHSTVYTSFEGGDGQVGLHGTDAPEKIGTDVSHGCIRMKNAVITRLAKRVPIGTPVTIQRS